MDYRESVDFLFGLQRLGARRGTEVVGSLLARLGDPHQALHAVLIAGTNGKGSTAAFLDAVLRAAGIRTGLYTSPHLVRFEERIQVDGRTIPPEEVARLATLLREVSEQMAGRGGEEHRPTFFETATAMAFQHFRDRKVELAVLEVGMGGRLDATSVVEDASGLFTPIDLDHQEVLGPTIADIAREKAGILKVGGQAVSAPQAPEVMEILRRAASVRGTTLLEAESVWRFSDGEDGTLSLVAGGDSRVRIDGITLALAGRHQRVNALLAAAAATRLSGIADRVTDQAIRRGLASARWPGRCEVIEERPTLVLDGAHNPAGAAVLRQFLIENHVSQGRRVALVFGAMQDKDLPGLMKPLLECAAVAFLTRAETPRAADPAVLEGVARRFHARVVRAPSLSAALSAARDEAGPDGVVCVAGSLYLVGDVMALREGIEPRSRQAL